MQAKEYFYIGYISKTHGVKGDVMVKADVDDILLYKNLKSVFLKMEESYVEKKLAKVSIKDSKAMLLNFESHRSIEAVQDFVGTEVYGPISFLKPLTGNRFYFHEILNFEVIDDSLGSIGKIKQVLEMPTQSLFQIIHPSKKEILIPIVDAVIKLVDREKRCILITAPNGLVELYLT